MRSFLQDMPKKGFCRKPRRTKDGNKDAFSFNRTTEVFFQKSGTKSLDISPDLQKGLLVGYCHLSEIFGPQKLGGEVQSDFCKLKMNVGSFVPIFGHDVYFVYLS